MDYKKWNSGTYTGETFEGNLIRKHTFEGADRKASNR